MLDVLTVNVMKSGNLNFLEPSGPLQACNGTALPLLKVNRACPTGRIDQKFGPVFIVQLRMKISSVLCSVSVLLQPVDSFVCVHLGLPSQIKLYSLMC